MGEIVVNPGAVDNINSQIEKLTTVHHFTFTPTTLPSRFQNWASGEVFICGNMCTIIFAFEVKNSQSASSDYETICSIDISDYIDDDEEDIDSWFRTYMHVPITDSSNGIVFMRVTRTSTNPNKLEISAFMYGSTSSSGIHMVRGTTTFPFKTKVS